MTRSRAHRLDEVVGYVFWSERLCRLCTLYALLPHRLIPEELLDEDAEQVLDVAARAAGIDRHDETSFETWEFPKRILLSQIDPNDACERCRWPLGNGPPPD